MRFQKRILGTLGVLLITCSTAQARSWTDLKGRSIQAELVEVKDGEAVLKKPDGKIIKISVSKLVFSDRIFITRWEQKTQKKAGPDYGKIAREDFKNLNGHWKIVSYKKNGKAVELETLGHVDIDGEKITMASIGWSTSKDKFSLDPSKKPKYLNWIVTKVDTKYDPPEIKRELRKCIYSIQGDTFQLCWQKNNLRPTEFATKKRDERHLFVLKRVRKKP